MIELVIGIDENVFTRLFDNGIEDYAIVNDDLFAIAKSIRKCTPLPEHHGRLIDADALIFNADYYEPLISKRDVDFAPTIIEAADKEE